MINFVDCAAPLSYKTGVIKQSLNGTTIHVSASLPQVESEVRFLHA
jgi:hypothetical protein